MASDAHVAHSYKSYWVAWLFLLVITVTMVFLREPAILLAGIMLKATVIALWFMHLKYEMKSFIWLVTLSILATGLILFVLIAPDGMAM